MRASHLADVRFDRSLRHGWCHPGPAFGAEHVTDLMTTMLSVWMVLNAVAAIPWLVGESRPRAWRMKRPVGGSFAGKSTWAALLYAEGARFITDDALPVVNHQGRPTLTGAFPEMRLRTFSEKISGRHSTRWPGARPWTAAWR